MSKSDLIIHYGCNDLIYKDETGQWESGDGRYYATGRSGELVIREKATGQTLARDVLDVNKVNDYSSIYIEENGKKVHLFKKATGMDREGRDLQYYMQGLSCGKKVDTTPVRTARTAEPRDEAKAALPAKECIFPDARDKTVIRLKYVTKKTPPPEGYSTIRVKIEDQMARYTFKAYYYKPKQDGTLDLHLFIGSRPDSDPAEYILPVRLTEKEAKDGSEDKTTFYIYFNAKGVASVQPKYAEGNADTLKTRKIVPSNTAHLDILKEADIAPLYNALVELNADKAQLLANELGRLAAGGKQATKYGVINVVKKLLIEAFTSDGHIKPLLDTLSSDDASKLIASVRKMLDNGTAPKKETVINTILLFKPESVLLYRDVKALYDKLTPKNMDEFKKYLQLMKDKKNVVTAEKAIVAINWLLGKQNAASRSAAEDEGAEPEVITIGNGKKQQAAAVRVAPPPPAKDRPAEQTAAKGVTGQVQMAAPVKPAGEDEPEQITVQKQVTPPVKPPVESQASRPPPEVQTSRPAPVIEKAPAQAAEVVRAPSKRESKSKYDIYAEQLRGAIDMYNEEDHRPPESYDIMERTYLDLYRNFDSNDPVQKRQVDALTIEIEAIRIKEGKSEKTIEQLMADIDRQLKIMDATTDKVYIDRLNALHARKLVYDMGSSISVSKSGATAFAQLLTLKNITLSEDIITGEMDFNVSNSHGNNWVPIYYIAAPAEQLPRAIAASSQALPKIKWAYYLADSEGSEDMIKANLGNGIEAKRLGTSSNTVIIFFVPEKSAADVQNAPSILTSTRGERETARSIMEKAIKAEISARFQK